MKRCIVLLSMAIAQFAFGQTDVARETWSGIGVPLTEWGAIYGEDRCNSGGQIWGIEFPVESGAYFTWSGLWFGAEIVNGNTIQRRVSVFGDLFSNPPMNELHSTNGLGIQEFAHVDTVNCAGENVYDPYARADHVFAVELCDTLTDPLYVREDPEDGNHVPLGLKIEMTSYAFLDFCPRVVWVQLHVSNIGQHTLRNLWFGLNSFVNAEYRTTDSTYDIDGMVGFEHEKEFAYYFSKTGRLPDDPNGNDFMSEAAIGIIPLINRSYQAIGFNWWHDSEDWLDVYGPAWESYAVRDSLGMGWTGGNDAWPNGDLRKYQLMTNREQDFDPLRMHDAEWIEQNTPSNQTWASSSFGDITDGWTRTLISAGPYGQIDGEFTRLRPGESTDMWFAVMGGQGFHDMNHPQEGDTIDPDLYDLSGLLDAAFIAGESPCFEYLSVGERQGNSGVVEKFAFHNAYPNPFNSSVDLIFESPVGQLAEVQIMDILGREIETVYSGITQAGETRIRWQPKDLSSGVYFARLTGKGEVGGTQKLLFLK